jgi:hypothetical protein
VNILAFIPDARSVRFAGISLPNITSNTGKYTTLLSIEKSPGFREEFVTDRRWAGMNYRIVGIKIGTLQDPGPGLD